jgi:hypothetical protein
MSLNDPFRKPSVRRSSLLDNLVGGGQQRFRDGKAERPGQPSLGQVTMRRVLKAVASEMGKRSGKARMASTTPEERRRIGQLGARARWGRNRP